VNTKTAGVQSVEFISINGGRPRLIEGRVAEESLACISVNGMELATFMCSPHDLDKLALGFLFNENVIAGPEEIASLHISDSHCVDIWLTHDFEPPERLIVTAGCGGGVTFDDLSGKHEPLDVAAQAAPAELAELMRRMLLGAELYKQSRGIHTAALASRTEILLQVEDIGRHNCLDKLAGAALQTGLDTRGKIILSSGRISSEMLNKARRLAVPIVCSRTSPTSLSVALAEAWNITIVAYLRKSRMRVYTHAERVVVDAKSRSSA